MTRLQRQKDQSVQCSIQDNISNVNNNENVKPSTSTKKNEDCESVIKNDIHSKFLIDIPTNTFLFMNIFISYF